MKGIEAEGYEGIGGEDGAAVEDEGGFEHEVMDAGEVEGAEFIPLGERGKRVGPGGGGVWIGADFEVGGEDFLGDAGVGEVAADGVRVDARVVNGELGVLPEEVAADMDGGGFAGVVGVLFEGEAKDGDALAIDRVEEGTDDFFHKARLLPIVEMNDLPPVFRDMGEMEGFAEVNEIEQVLLETRAAKTDRGLEKFRTDARVHADGAGDFVDIGTGGFAEGGDRIDRRNALGEEGVGDQFGKFGRPEVGGEDAFAGNPVGVNGNQRLDGGIPRRGDLAADEDAVRVFQIIDSSAFGEEFRIGQHLEGGFARRIRGEDGLDGAGGFHRDGALLDDDLVAMGNLGDEARGGFNIAQVGSASGTDAVGFGGRADGNKDQVRGGDGGADVRGEMEIAAAGGGNHRIEAGFIDRQGIGVPGVDALAVHVGHGDLEVRTFGGDHRHGGAADVAGAEAADGFYFHGNSSKC